jgi:hypothetical protein
MEIDNKKPASAEAGAGFLNLRGGMAVQSLLAALYFFC